MLWTMLFEDPEAGWWLYSVVGGDRAFTVRIRLEAPGHYQWWADKGDTSTTQSSSDPKLWTMRSRSVNPKSISFDSWEAAEAWADAVIDGRIELPSDAEGVCEGTDAASVQACIESALDTASRS